jgi:hypothetical protein
VPVPLTARAGHVRELVADYTLRQKGSSLDTVLQTALETVQRSSRELSDAANLLVALQDGDTTELSCCNETLKRVRAAADTVSADPIAHADSDDGRELVRALTDATRELDAEVNRLWMLVHSELDGEYPEEFVASMARVQAFATDARAVKEARERLVRALELRRPDPNVVQRARQAKKEIEQGLQRLNELVPREVQTQFARAVNGTLPLTDVDATFLKWIKEKGLEQSFRVTVR